MPTSGEYRQHAEDCLKLANTATDHFAKVALEELAHEFQREADKLDNSESDITDRLPQEPSKR